MLIKDSDRIMRIHSCDQAVSSVPDGAEVSRSDIAAHTDNGKIVRFHFALTDASTAAIVDEKGIRGGINTMSILGYARRRMRRL